MLTLGTAGHVSIVDDPRTFSQSRAEWNELLSASAANSPFLTWEWLHPWWTHLAGASRLRLVTLRSEQTLLAVAPLRVSRGHLPFQQLEFLGTGYAGSDYLDVIVRRGVEQEGLLVLADRLARDGRAMFLHNVSTNALALDLASTLQHAGWSAWTRQHAVCMCIPLAGHTWDSYLATLGSAHRANVRRRIRAIERDFTVRFEAVRTERERADALAALIVQHEARWGSRSTAFCTPELRAFHDDVTRLALQAGWLRLYTLRLNDAIAAVMYGFSYDRRFYFFQHAFDAAYQQYSLGLALMGLTIRAAIEEGTSEFDMLYGNESYKSLWAPAQRTLAQVRLFPPHLAGTLHRKTVEAERTVRALVRRVMPRGGSRAA